MKLYYSPGACSLASHIALREAGYDFSLEKVDRSKRTENGEDFLAVNPNGYVPALKLSDDDIMLEGSAILQWVADTKPAAGLLPPVGSRERYRTLEWLTFVSSELHKNFSPFFNPSMPDEAKALYRANLDKRLAHVEGKLKGATGFLTGDRFTIADAYLFVVLGWAKFLQIDLSPYPAIGAYLGRVASRPSVQAALKAEGLA
ncbi:MAG TPA: glutathione transferase GstA [Azospirillaceae bacterium]|nr:glutathione transferase GstA [Azospirillaceae bacterium]